MKKSLKIVLNLLLSLTGLLAIISCQNEDVISSSTNEATEITKKSLRIDASTNTIAGAVASHDPSTIVKSGNNYYVFTTGDNVPMAYTTNLSNWIWGRPAFSKQPSWITNYVPGFNKFYWAPDVAWFNNRWNMYYSCSAFGSDLSAIGLATTNTLSPTCTNWQDQGLVVSSSNAKEVNAIDPSILVDGTNVYMAYGSFRGGIGVVRINPSTGKPVGTRTIVAGGNDSDWEGACLIKNENYYYMFVNRGWCCRGVNSTYYVVVGRSRSPFGPFTDKNGVSLKQGGGTTLLTTQKNYIGPGHIGYSNNILSYHFYDGNDNGAPKLITSTLSWVNGWPVPESANQTILSNGTYTLQNRATGQYLDNLWANTNGSNVGQWPEAKSNNQKWVITYSNGFYKLQCVTGGLYLDSVGRTADGSEVGLWESSPHYNQNWIIDSTGPYYKIINRSNGKCLDTGGSTSNGSSMQFWSNGQSFNQQWTLVKID